MVDADAESLELSKTKWTIRDLSKEELKFVVRTFAQRIGADRILEDAYRRRAVITPECLRNALSLNDWPGEDARCIEMAWVSQPLKNTEYKRLSRYSVFWQVRGGANPGLDMWIGREPQKPNEEEAILSDRELLQEICNVYPFYVSNEMRDQHILRQAKWHLTRVSVIVVTSAVAFGIVFTVLVQAFGFSWTLVYLLLANALLAAVGYRVAGFAARRFGIIGASTFLLLTLLIILWILQEFLYPAELQVWQRHSVIFCASLLIALYATSRRCPYSLSDLIGLPSRERFRLVYDRSIKPTSIGTVFAYSVVRLAEHSLINDIRSGDSLILIILLPMAIVTIIEFMRRDARN